jgi:hypothetical protein
MNSTRVRMASGAAGSTLILLGVYLIIDQLVP